VPAFPRARMAAKGLAITLVAPAVIALLQIVFAREILIFSGFYPENVDAYYLPGIRREFLVLQLGAAVSVFFYWLAMALFCRGDLLRIRSANACLLLSGLIFEAWAIFGPLDWVHRVAYQRLCSALGVRESSEITYGFDPVSNCDLFWRAWGEPIFIGPPLALLLASALLRIFISRSRLRGTRP